MVPDLSDELTEHIRVSKLPLIFSKKTRADGNCWYDAAADQGVQHGITGKPWDHLGMRATVCDAMVSMSEAEEWSENHFGGSWRSFLEFVSANSLPGTWTDEAGIMVQATAIFLGRIIRIVGTINAGHGDGWTTIEAGAEAELLPPLHIGYYQDVHYQSLALVPGTASSLHSQDGNNREVPALPSVAAQSSPPPRPTPVRRALSKASL